MTPFRNDASNPFERESLWPRLPQTPLEISGGTRAAFAVVGAAGDDELFFESHDLSLEPGFEGLGAVAAPERRGLQPVPFLVAAAVGVVGLTTLYLVIGLPV